MSIRPFLVRIALCAGLAVATLVTTMVPAATAQDLHPSRRPSPMGMARLNLDDAYLRVIYSRPYERRRDMIFGTEEEEALVPYGKIWRTGANEATEITVTEDVMVAGEQLPAGTYSLFTVPGAEEWAVHFVSTLGMVGTGVRIDGEFTPVDIPEATVVKVMAAVTTLGDDEEKVDQFTISWDPQDDRSAHLVLGWIRTEVRVPFALAGEM